MSKVKPTRYKTKWRTIDNNNDSGIFAMRHMETFKGETVSRYDAGFVKESAAQEVQLNKFRMKYLAKILLSKHNIWRSRIIKQATDFPHFTQVPGRITKTIIQEKMKSKNSQLC